MGFPFTDFRYYGPDGLPGDVEYRVADIDKRRIARTDGLTLDGKPVYVSTILCANAVVFSGPEEDKPFETQIRTTETEENDGLGEVLMTLRYPTRHDAEVTHGALVQLLQGEAGRSILEDLIRARGDDE